MDLYFHRTPSPTQHQRQKPFSIGDKIVNNTITWKNQILERKPLLVYNSNSVAPQKTTQKIENTQQQQHQHHLADYIQQQRITVTSQAKKLWKQWNSNSQFSISSSRSNSSKNNSNILKESNNSSHCSSILLFDSSEHETPSTPPLSFHSSNSSSSRIRNDNEDGNKRSFTAPNLMGIIDDNNDINTDENKNDSSEREEKKKKPFLKDYRLLTRALPSLPFSTSYYPSSLPGNLLKKKTNITRATTWVGRSIQKWISNEEQRKVAILLDSELEDSIFDEQIPDLSIYNKVPQKLINGTKKMVLNCKVLQISNLTSSKAYEYNMDIMMGELHVLNHQGCLKKVFKGVSVDNPYASFSVDIEGPFELECQINMKPFVTSRSRLLKKIISKNDTKNDNEENMIKGRLVLNSGKQILSSFANKGISRFTIETAGSLCPLEMELTAVFCLEEKKEIVTSYGHIDDNIKKYCEAGDYLTFYIRTESCPMWIRYWATFENNYLVIRSNERGEPVEKFLLENLTEVDTNPSEDTLEEIYLGKRHVMTLVFGSNGKMYLFGDSYTSVCYWKSLLEQSCCRSSSGISSDNDNSNSIQKKTHVIQRRYIW